MKPFHKQLKDRLEATGDFSQPMWHFMADVLEHTANEADKWTNRADDARRIPDMIDEACHFCREEAKNHEVADPVVVRLERENDELRSEVDRLNTAWQAIDRANESLRERLADAEAERDEARIVAQLYHDDATAHGRLESDTLYEAKFPWLVEGVEK